MTGNDAFRRTPIGAAMSTGDRIKDLESRIARLPSPYSLPTRLSVSGAEVTDWDNVTEVGFYWSTAGAANEPDPRNLVGRVFVHGNGRIMQEVSDPTTTLIDLEKTWRRVWDGTTWTAWRLLGGGGYPDLDPFQVGANDVTWGSGWSNYTSSNWGGVWLARRAGIMTISGAAAKSSWSVSDQIINLPAGMRPIRQAQGVGVQALSVNSTSAADGINAGSAGSAAISFSITFPVGA